MIEIEDYTIVGADARIVVDDLDKEILTDRFKLWDAREGQL